MTLYLDDAGKLNRVELSLSYSGCEAQGSLKLRRSKTRIQTERSPAHAEKPPAQAERSSARRAESSPARAESSSARRAERLTMRWAAGPLPVFDLGIAPYEPVQRLQGRLRRAVADRILPGVILLLEHEPVITLGSLGSRGSPGDLCDLPLIRGLGIQVVPSERGGQATLHAPGQLISYLIVPIPGRDLRGFVHNLEETLLVLLADLGIQAHRHEGRPGLYVKRHKIASVGLRCHRWVASHGTSLNIDLDLSLFDLIVSCGEPQLRQTSVRAVTGLDCGMDILKSRYAAAASQVFGWELTTPRAAPHDQVETALGLPGETAEDTL